MSIGTTTRTVSFAALTAATFVAASLVSAPQVVAAPTPPPEQHVEGGPKVVHNYEPGLIPGIDPPTGEDSPMAARSVHPAGDVKITLVRAQPKDMSRAAVDSVSLAAATEAIDVADRYWSDMSEGRISLSVAETKPRFQTDAKSTWNYWDIMAQVTKELNWSYQKNRVLIVFVPTQTLSAGAYGAGWSTDGTSGRILMPRPSTWGHNSLTDSVLAHEFGHVFGLGHANALTCSDGGSDTPDYAGCWVRAYGDTLDLMGTSQVHRPTISASFWDIAGFGSYDDIRNVGSVSGSKSYILRPWGGEKSNRAVKFRDPVSGENYYLELRLPVDEDRFLSSGLHQLNRGVKITQVPAYGQYELPSSIVLEPDTRPFANYYSMEHAWQAGQVFTTHAGTQVKVNWISGSGPHAEAKVTITAPGPSQAAGPFTDVDGGTAHQDAIRWAYDNKITTGYDDGTYRPYSAINRDAMAAFLYRLEGEPSFTPPRTSPFKDYPRGSKFYKEVTWLESTGITTGYDDDTFRPVEPINRDAMAAFLYRLADKPHYSPPSQSPFTDVQPGDKFYKEITWLKSTKITTGWKDGTFRPRADIKRDAMAAFLQRFDTKF
ncbi:hypothetical protein GCM10027402_27380 [Arthrobacter monumenti]